MKQRTYYGLDIAKFISAFLVIAIHTAPLIQIDEQMNFIVVQIISRIAVPFFFITSGFLFFRKLDLSREWNDYENLARLKHYLFRIAKMYIIWTILYLPFNYLIVRSDGITLQTLLGFLRDFFVNGGYYHLWFLPALMFAVAAVYLIASRFSIKSVLWVSVILYTIGMIGNVYEDAILQIPVISSVYTMYLAIFTTTRNGLFFGMMFISLGAYFAQKPMLVAPAGRYIGFLLSLFLLIGEAFLIRQSGMMRDLTSMYLCLIPTTYFLFEILIHIQLRKRGVYSFLRSSSLLIYVSHLMFVVMIQTVFPHVGNLSVYVLSALGSFIFSILIYFVSKKVTIVKQLY